MSLANMIQEFCEIMGYQYRKDYSGRYMFGKECVGIVTGENIVEVIIKLADYLYECGVSSVEKELGKVCYDNMGVDMIIYFPNVSVD